MITVYDVAQACGLSIASVSRALNGRPGVSPETVERVVAVADSLGYQRNEVARALVAGSTETIALLVPDITNPFFPELVKGVQTAADGRDVLLLLLDVPTGGSRLRSRIEALRRKQIDGMIFVASETDDDLAVEIGGLPTVLLDRARPGALPSVGIDQEAAAYDAVSYLIRAGHRTIGHVAGPAHLRVAELRRNGWHRALRESGLSHADELIEHGDFEEQGGYRAAGCLLERRPDVDAIFAANDMSAIGVLARCAAVGRRVPDDLSVIGIDGIEMTRYTNPALTTVAQPIRELGAVACEQLFEAIADGGPRGDVVLPTTIVEGRSVRARTSSEGRKYP